MQQLHVMQIAYSSTGALYVPMSMGCVCQLFVLALGCCCCPGQCRLSLPDSCNPLSAGCTFFRPLLSSVLHALLSLPPSINIQEGAVIEKALKVWAVADGCKWASVGSLPPPQSQVLNRLS